jgi:hypothetical protein
MNPTSLNIVIPTVPIAFHVLLSYFCSSLYHILESSRFHSTAILQPIETPVFTFYVQSREAPSYRMQTPILTNHRRSRVFQQVLEVLRKTSVRMLWFDSSQTRTAIDAIGTHQLAIDEVAVVPDEGIHSRGRWDIAIYR